jgi:hypothetical protein
MNEPMTASAEIEPAVETALTRVSREPAEIAQMLAKLEILLSLIASAAAAK